MASTLEKLSDDLRTNLVGLLLTSLFGGGLLTAIAQAVRTMHNHPFEWPFIWVIFVISALALAVIILLLAGSGRRIQQQSSQISIAPRVGESAADEINALFHRIDPRFTGDFTAPFQQHANQIPAGPQRDNYFIQALTVVVISLQLEILWYNIFGNNIVH